MLQLLVCACGVFLIGSCSVYESATFKEYEIGAKQASKDISMQRYSQIDNLGILRYGTQETRSNLRKLYGIRYWTDYTLSGDYVRGYNSMMRAAFIEKFGEMYFLKALPKDIREQQRIFDQALGE